MVKKVYKSEKINKTRKIKKKIPKIITEKYQEKIPHSRQVYHGPSSSGRCLHCGVTLRSSMWRYQGMSDKYLCPDCWYSLSSYKRDEYRRKAHQGYYSSETYYTYETRTRKKTIEEEVEVDENYTETKTFLIYPKKIEYNEKNNVYTNELTLSKILESKVNNIDNTTIKDEDGWYGCYDNNVNFNNMKSNDHILKNEDKMWGLGDIVFNEMIISEKQTLEEYCDVVGFYPNVPAFIQGHPLSMYNNKRKNVIELEKSVTIFVNLAIDSKSNYKQYQDRGRLIISLIEEIKKSYVNPNEKIKVNLTLLDATYIDGETIIQKINIYHDDLIKNSFVVNKILTNISFFRLLLLDKKIDFIKKMNLSSEWMEGQGFIVDNFTLRKLLGLVDTDILIGSVEEIGITSIYEDDDHVSFLESINLLDHSIFNSLNDDIKELSIEEVLTNRNITKLIHVTNKKNLESIKKYGLLPVNQLEKQNINFENNDPLRLDNKKDAICLSVTDYNNFLFHAYQKRYPKNEYVVLEIDPKILLDKEIEKIFCDYNAASKFSQRSSTNMEIMFKDTLKRRAKIKTRAGKKINEPTSFQAEILFCGKIDPKYIINEYTLEKIKLK